MSNSVTISMPLSLQLGKSSKSKVYHINLNNYRKWHFQTSNPLTKKYKLYAFPQIHKLRFHKKIKLEFVMWRGDKRRIDRANVLSIHEKFFCDALVETGCIRDDDDEWIESTLYRTGGIDMNNPRVDIIITEIDENVGQEELF